MRRVATFGILCAFALGFGNPLIACALEYEQLTAEEQGCCREMDGDCGSRSESSHSCCAEKPSFSQSPVSELKQQPRFEFTCTPVLSGMVAEQPEPEEQPSLAARLQPIGKSPPGLASILRI